MDRKIKAIEAEVPKHSKAHKDLKQLEKMDKKRDKVCDLGKKEMKKEKEKHKK